MSISNTVSTYGSVTKWFHWITAALIFVIIPLGLIANRLPYDTDAELTLKANVFTIHKTLGVLVFFVALARIVWAASQPKPGPLHPNRKAETFLAELVHWLLYGSLVLAPISGWIEHAATTGFAPIWWPFGQSLPFVPKDPELAETFANLHWIWTKVMAISILLHVAGALKHQFVDKDITLARMWFGDRIMPEVRPHLPPLAAPFLTVAIFAFTGVAYNSANAPVHADETSTVESTEATIPTDGTSGWTIESGTLGLAVQQMGSDVSGEFGEWTADITFDPSSQSGEVKVEISISSVTLGSITDQALGATYFDAANFPKATFIGPITHIDGDSYQTEGMLTLKGASAPVTLDYTMTNVDGLWTMTGQSQLDRRDYGIGDTDSEANVGFPVMISVTLTAQQPAQ